MRKMFTPNKTMLQDYIQNKLSSEETEQLELWLADHPEVMDELELDMMIKQSSYSIERPEDSNKVKVSWWYWLTNPKLVPLHLAAYAMTALFIVNTFNSPDAGFSSSPATFIELEKVRGAETDIIKIDMVNKKSLVVRFFPDSLTENYQVIIQSQETNQKLTFDNLVADNLGSITISINDSKKLTGQWEVLILDDTLKVEQDFMIEII